MQNTTQATQTTSPDTIDWIGADDAARMLNVSIETVHRWRRAGILKAARLNPKRGHWRFDRSQVYGILAQAQKAIQQ